MEHIEKKAVSNKIINLKGFSEKRLKTPKSAGQILKSERLKKNIPFEEVEKETKIRIRYIQAIENGDYDILPSSVYAIGFLKRYANFLAINSTKLIKLYKQEADIYHISANSKIIPSRQIKEIKLLITPKLIAIGFVSVIVLSLFIYMGFSISGLLSAPDLEIFYPIDQAKVNQEVIIVEGKTEETAKLFINDHEVVLDENGAFIQEVKLEKGLNKLKIVSQNKINKKTEKDLTILVE